MLRTLLLFLLLVVAAPARALDVCQPPRVVPGQRVVFEASGAPPGARVAFIRGDGPGQTCPVGLGGACFNLSHAVLLATIPADAQGNARFDRVLPANLPAGFRFGVQVAVRVGGRFLLSHPFFAATQLPGDPSTACATGRVCATQDADLDGVNDLCDLCADDSATCPSVVPNPNRTCSARGWVGVSATGNCADLVPSNETALWDVRPTMLRSNATPAEIGWFNRLPPELRGLCSLSPALGASQPAGRADPDCEIMNTFSTPADVSNALLDPLRDAFLTNSGGPVGAVLEPDAPWVAVIDTAVTRAPGIAVDPPDQARHGCSMTALVHDLTCDARGSCGVKVGTWLALDRDPNAPGGVNTVAGGYLGTQATLATRILDAVRDWDLAGRPGPLVIHLAVGWEPEYTWRAGSPGTESVGARTVRLALEYAACQGALIVAAAGNERGGPVPSPGPMYPAAWAANPAPDCAATGTSREAGLLYAVDAVGEDGSLILRSRDMALPRLVAWGWQAMADIQRWAPSCGLQGAPVTALTGTSVATAVLAAAAASAWRVNPALTPAEVMDVVYEGGATPAGPAPAGGWWSQFGPNGPVAVRQASVCGATNMACATIGSPPGCSVSCPAPSSCAWGWEPVPDDDVDGSALSVLGPYDCGTGPCAHDALPSSFDIPWTLSPQPATDACTECWFNLAAGANRLHLVMNPELPLVRYDARLVLFSAGGTRLGVLDLASLPWGAGVVGDGLSPGDLLDISSLPTPPASASKARLDVRVAWGGGNWSMMSEVPILW